MDWIPDIIKLAEKRFHTWLGLAFSLTVALSAGYGAALIFSAPFVSIIDSLFDHPPSLLYSYSTLIYYTLIITAVSVLWVVRRRIPRFKQNRIGVLFSSINPEEQANEVSQLRSRVVEELKRLDMLDLIDIRDLPANQKITQARDALAAINIAEGTLLIWGHFQTGHRGNQKHAGFPTIHFTYRHPSNVSIHFHNEIGESLSQRKWTYGDGNDFVETSVVASNIAQVALFIIGLTLLAWQDYARAETVLVPLDLSLEPFRQGKHNMSLSRFCGLVRTNRLRCTVLQIGSEYDKLIWRRGIYDASQQELDTWDSKLTEAITFDKQESSLYHHLAVINFLKGNTDEAIRAAKKSKKLAARGDAIPDFSLGFLHLYKGDIKKGLQNYRIALAKVGAETRQNAFFEIVTFIRQVLDKYPNKIQLHFALGLINEERLDPEIAKEEYKALISYEQQQPQLSMLFMDAKQRLHRLTT